MRKKDTRLCFLNYLVRVMLKIPHNFEPKGKKWHKTQHSTIQSSVMVWKPSFKTKYKLIFYRQDVVRKKEVKNDENNDLKTTWQTVFQIYSENLLEIVNQTYTRTRHATQSRQSSSSKTPPIFFVQTWLNPHTFC